MCVFFSPPYTRLSARISDFEKVLLTINRTLVPSGGPALHVVLLATRIIKPTFNRPIPTIFSPLKITRAKIQKSHTLFLAAFNDNNLPSFSSRVSRSVGDCKSRVLILSHGRDGFCRAILYCVYRNIFIGYSEDFLSKIK